MTPLNDQRGFTLIEVLIATTLTLIVFGATLTVLDVFMHQSNASTQRYDAQDRARIVIDRIARQLRNVASPISSPKLLERATPYDIVFQTVATPSGSNSNGAERIRYCIPPDTPSGNPANEVLISQTQTWSTATPPASPWTSDPNVTIPCPDTSTPSSVILGQAVTNRYQGANNPAFSFTYSGGSSLNQVIAVQIDLFVNPTPKFRGAQTELRSGAYLRNQLRSPVANFTYTATGGGAVLLNGGTSYSPDGGDLTYSWSCTSPAACPAASSLTSQKQGLVSWTPGAGTYTVQLTVTDAAGLSNTYPLSVTVT